MKITSFTQLIAWQKAHRLVLVIFKISEKFPKAQQYILTSQILRSAISITSNIAEGFSRQSKKEKIQFYSVAKGSLTEIQNQLLIARDVEYISKKKVFTECISTLPQLFNIIFIRHTKSSSWIFTGEV